MPALTDQDLNTRLDEEIRGAVGYASSELSDQRKTALEYYYGEPFGNESEGRSSYVSRDVADTIEWIMPSLMRIFMGGDTIVRFEPQGPEDEQNAQQATDFVNYVFQRQNDGFLTLYTFCKDALLSKNGFTKVYAEEYTESKTQTYDSLTEDEFAMLLKDVPQENILEHSAFPGELGISHAVKFRTSTKKKKCCVVPVPPEEILVNKNPVAPLKRNRFVCHRRRVTISELKEMGFENVDDVADNDTDLNLEKITRHSYDQTDSSEDHKDDANREVWLSEAYWRVDKDGDGIAELRKTIKAGNRVLEDEECDSFPIVTMTPIILPHKLYGMSVADLVMDLQLLKSTVFRQILDNMYLANNGRYMALDGMVNIDDLLTSRPGGIVRVKTFDAVKPMQPPLLGAPAFSLLEYIDTIKENRTGVTRYNQGVDADSLNKTAQGINQIMSASQQRVELIARVFAETGVKDLFYAILEVVQKHYDKEQVIRLRNEWVKMDPQEWTNKFDLTVMVGLGTGSKEAQIAALMQTIQFQMGALQGGLPIVTPENVYNTGMKLLEAQNIKGGDMFFTHPEKMPPQQPQPSPELIKAEVEKMKLEGKAALQQMKDETKQQQMMMKQDFDAAKTKYLTDAELQRQREQQSVDVQKQREIEGAKKQEQDKARSHETAGQIMDIIAKQKQSQEESLRGEQQEELKAMLAMMQDNTSTQNQMILQALQSSLEAERETEVSERDAKGKVKKTVSRVKKKDG